MKTALPCAAGAALLALTLLLPSSCRRAPREELTLLHTGRLAGNIYPADLKGAPLQHYPYLAGYVKQVRAEAAARGATVLLIDSGDSFTGSFASHATGGRNVAEFFKALQYDAVCLGNLDADADPAVITGLGIPVLCPFVRDGGAPVYPGALPVAQFTRGSLAIRLIANFYGQFDPGQNPGRFPMWFGPGDQPVQPVREYGPWLAQAPPAGLTLYHWMKFEGEGQPTDTTRTLLKTLNADAVLAHRIYSTGQREVWTRGDYSTWPVPVSENILRHNRGFTLARLDLERHGGPWHALRPPELLQMTANTAPADPAITGVIARFAGDIRAADEHFGTLPAVVSRDTILQAVLVALTRLPDVDAAAYSPNSVREELPAGPLTSSRLYDALPWSGNLEILTLDTAQYDQVRAMPDLRLLRRSVLPVRDIRLVTSRFFSKIIQRALSLSPDRVRAIPDTNEFRYLCLQRLKNEGPGLLQNPVTPDGWQPEPPP